MSGREIGPELRRLTLADLDSLGEDAELVRRIGDEIRRDGPMPFARFMELALYDPSGGYYRGPAARPGRAGDFITAPELHPIFGASLATAIGEIWERLGRPDPFVIREHGAGEGAMAVAILDAIDDPAFARAVRYGAVEVDQRRIAALDSRLAATGHARHLDDRMDEPFDGVVLANEVLDALPTHRVRVRGGRLHELAVDVGPDGGFVELEIAPTTPALAERLSAEAIELVEGQTGEVCLAVDDWVATAAAPLRRGALLLIDYGAPAAELYDPVRRRDGTLRAYARQQVHADPYRHVGRQDLTAHVDVTAVERAAHAAGLSTIGITTQAEALIGLGIEERLRGIQADPATTLEAYTLVRAALMRMLDPAAMGRFVVMAFARDWPEDAADPPLRLFSFRLATHPTPDRRPTG